MNKDQKEWEEQKLIATLAVKEFYPHYINDKELNFREKILYSVWDAKRFVEKSMASFEDLQEEELIMLDRKFSNSKEDK